MADEGRWIATPEGKPISVKVDNMLKPQKPIPVVDNLPLEDYQNLEKELTAAHDEIESYKRLIKNVFGDITFIENIKPYDVSAERIDDIATGEVLFFVKYKVKTKDLEDFEYATKGRNLLPLY